MVTPTPVFLPGELHGQKILAAYSPWGHKELDTTKQLIRRHINILRACFTIIDFFFLFCFILYLLNLPPARSHFLVSKFVRGFLIKMNILGEKNASVDTH